MENLTKLRPSLLLLLCTCSSVLQVYSGPTKRSSYNFAKNTVSGYYYVDDFDRTFYSHKCDGEENLKNDLGIISFVLGGISSVAGLFSLTTFSWPSNLISIISTILSLILWVPSFILTYLAHSDPVSYVSGNLVNFASLFVSLYGGLGIVTGSADILISTMDEVLGIVGLIISMLTTYPEMYNELKQLLQEWFGKAEVNAWIAGYGCEGGNNGIPSFVRQLVVG